MFDFNKVIEAEEEKIGEVVPKPKEYLARFDAHKAELQEMQERAKSIEVKDRASAELATTWGVEAARLGKEIEKYEKDLIEEPNKFVKSVRAAARRYLEPLEAVKDALRAKIRDYQSWVELERRKQEDAARKAGEEVQRKIDEQAAAANRIALENARRIAEERAAEEKRIAEEAARAAGAKKKDFERIALEAEEKRIALLKQAEEEAARNAIKAPQIPLPIIPKENGPTRGEEGGSASQRKTWLFEILNEIEIPREFLKTDESRIRQAIKMGVREIPGVRIFEDT
ncbi:MAG: hypothetical protein QME78_16750, partial [Thermodesulfobacteriota bacterium]|nr:hypothetical protein [Thermodesulfobacteriota bacterium]